jgi:TrpR family transcriptional regulator, trp operon repressor
MTDFADFITLVHSIKDKELLADLLLGVTTPKERSEFTQRIEIVRRLVRGDPQLKIAKDLGVGVATVTRGSKELALGRFKVLKENKES